MKPTLFPATHTLTLSLSLPPSYYLYIFLSLSLWKYIFLSSYISNTHTHPQFPHTFQVSLHFCKLYHNIKLLEPHNLIILYQNKSVFYFGSNRSLKIIYNLIDNVFLGFYIWKYTKVIANLYCILSPPTPPRVRPKNPNLVGPCYTTQSLIYIFQPCFPFPWDIVS